VETWNTSKWRYQGWAWGYVGLTVLAVAVLQVIAKFAINYPLINTGQLAVFVVVWFIVPRIRERRLGNTLAGVILVFVLDLILQLLLDPKSFTTHLMQTLQLNGFILATGLLIGYLYLRLSTWSENKRAQMDAKRNQTAGKQTASEKPKQRVHRKNPRRR